jgi:hypothetical protein
MFNFIPSMEGKNNILIDDHHRCKPTAMTPQELLKHLKDDKPIGASPLQLCTNEDGNTNNLVLYTVQNDTPKKGGNAPQAMD